MGSSSMANKLVFRMALGATLVLVATSCASPSETRAAPPSAAAIPPSGASAEPIEPLPRDVELDARKVALGEKLFADPRLSADGTVACTSCHLFSRGGADGLPRSHLPGRPEGKINVPTIWNAAYSFRLNWNGKFESLEDMMDAPMLGSSAMATSWPRVIQAVSSDPEYVAAFRAIYRDEPTVAAVRDAIATYERSLTTPDARFDRYLRGETQALGAEEKQGYTLFKEYGCTSCHQGLNVGGNLYQRLGVMGDYFAERSPAESSEADLGRFALTGCEADRHVFRVPSLRNVALTAPYLHDGSAATLEEAIAIMSRYQLGRTLDPPQIAHIAAFLGTLTGARAGVAP